MKYQLVNINDGFHKGWLKVKFFDQSIKIIPQGLIVFSTQHSDLYLISEGIYKGQKAFIHKKYLAKYSEKFENLELKIDIIKKKIYLRTLEYDVILNQLSMFNNKIMLLIPDYPHERIPSYYTNEKLGGSKFAETWFNLSNSNNQFIKTDKYFHFGNYSNGCITFPYTKQPQASKWNHIYQTLIKNRVMPGVCATIKFI